MSLHTLRFVGLEVATDALARHHVLPTSLMQRNNPLSLADPSISIIDTVQDTL